ncbi:4'-phosphopantetheinyl transferase family protein [Kribbella sp. CA-293567]|uniref:4'-phosphopantetheinyl transferase family protein n=1 Tax=Kribbella sp. CA-293567 TaxID=3002436 RepID=UPI0022DCF6A7|nr:4'-phosphopantetheinyl transferase superfamily protein [Kribbella sp. CA-293567]WBQ03242.1 4'-phosphopantetheinyl transferase superfamily protein [Kribbella sp. CA-293567]
MDIWWGRTADARPGLVGELDASERARLTAYARDEDKSRFLVGATIVRRVLSIKLELPPRDIQLDRTCPDCGRQHGKISVDGMQLSVSHSGDRVVVAFHPTAAVGVDVELINPSIDADSLASVSLSTLEAAELAGFEPAARARAFTQYWTRKEAVVKATGDGIRADLRKVIVSAPNQPPALREWAEYDGPVRLVDLPAGVEYAATLAILSEHTPEVRSFDAAPLLRS